MARDLRIAQLQDGWAVYDGTNDAMVLSGIQTREGAEHFADLFREDFDKARDIAKVTTEYHGLANQAEAPWIDEASRKEAIELRDRAAASIVDRGPEYVKAALSDGMDEATFQQHYKSAIPQELKQDIARWEKAASLDERRNAELDITMGVADLSPERRAQVLPMVEKYGVTPQDVNNYMEFVEKEAAEDRIADQAISDYLSRQTEIDEGLAFAQAERFGQSKERTASLSMPEHEVNIQPDQRLQSAVDRYAETHALDIQQVAIHGDSGSTPFLLPDGRLVDGGGDRISFADAVGIEPPYNQTVMERTGAVAVDISPTKSGSMVIDIHAREGQLLTKEQFDTVKQVYEIKGGAVAIRYSATNSENAAKYDFVGIDGLQDKSAYGPQTKDTLSLSQAANIYRSESMRSSELWAKIAEDSQTTGHKTYEHADFREWSKTAHLRNEAAAHLIAGTKPDGEAIRSHGFDLEAVRDHASQHRGYVSPAAIKAQSEKLTIDDYAATVSKAETAFAQNRPMHEVQTINAQAKVIAGTLARENPAILDQARQHSPELANRMARDLSQGAGQMTAGMAQ